MSHFRIRLILCFAAALLGALASSQAAIAQGAFDELRNDVRRTDRATTPKKDKKPSSDECGEESSDRFVVSWNDDCECEEEDTNGFLGKLLFLSVTSPFWGPPAAIGDDYDEQGEFFSYPYKRGWDGDMVIEPEQSRFTKPWRVRFRGEYADDFGRLSRAGGHLLFDTTSRMGFETEFNYRQESLTFGPHDELWTGDFNFVYRFAQTDHFQMRTGLGFNWLNDTIGSNFGFNFTYGGDWLPARPWILSSEIDWGTLGDANLFHGRATVGLQFRHVELYAGYDYYNVGDVQLDGVVTGLRFWF